MIKFDDFELKIYKNTLFINFLELNNRILMKERIGH